MLNKENLIIILDKLFDQSKKYYDDFNSADAKIGDGDLGITILHGLEEIQKNKVSFSNDMGENFMVCSKAFVKRSGSSFGTLIAFSLMNISKKMQGKTHCDHNDIINFFETALKTILERGKTNLGDKTIADTLDLIIKKIKKILWWLSIDNYFGYKFRYNYNKFLSSINLGKGLASLNEGDIEDGIKSLEKSSRYNNMSEVIETELFKENSRKKSLPFLFTKLSGSSLSGKNKKEICFSGFNSLIEFSAALKAAL